MNDLTFGAALLACFVTLATAAVFEPSAPTRKATAAQNAPLQIALAHPADCLTVAQAPRSR